MLRQIDYDAIKMLRHMFERARVLYARLTGDAEITIIRC